MEKIPKDIVGYTEYILNVKLAGEGKEILTTMHDNYIKGKLDTSSVMIAGRGSAKMNWIPLFAICIFRYEDWLKGLDSEPGIHRCTEDLIKSRIVCSSCKHFSTNGWIAPAGKCAIHPEFGNDPCALYEGGEEYVTYCKDFERRERG